MFNAISIMVGLIFITSFALIIFFIYRALTGHSNFHNNVTVNDKTNNQLKDMTAMLGKGAVDMAKEMNPEYKTLHCPNCGADLPDNLEQCEYCNSQLTKVAALNKK